MLYFCCNDRRREAIRGLQISNGIDFLEVFDDVNLPEAQRQRKLYVHFIRDLGNTPPTPDNLRIEGGERISAIHVTAANVGIDDQQKPPNVLTVQVDQPGDFSIYTLRLVQDRQDPQSPPLTGFDPLLSAVDFSFKVDCPNDFDCAEKRICPPEPLTEPEIDYLAKDYSSFRQVVLDRMTTLIPQWQERHSADIGIALVELLAYVGDYLSYQQDAIATEAYLGTARRRVSVRRHARLVDYFMHNGSNARAWIQVQVSADSLIKSVPKHTQFLTRIIGQPTRIPPDSTTYDQILGEHPEVFEAFYATEALYAAHNTLKFYTWGAQQCCLPKGATRATLLGFLQDADHTPPAGAPLVLHLKPGDVLIFQEVLGAHTGSPDDADPTRRHAVQLTSVRNSSDPVGGYFLNPPNNNPVDVTEIEWAAEDAPPFPFCISGLMQTDDPQHSLPLDNISIALGNVLLVDHGASISGEKLGQVPLPTLIQVVTAGGDHCQEQPALPVPPRFNPQLAQRPLTYAIPYDEKNPPTSALAAMTWTTSDTLPAIQLHSVLAQTTQDWNPRADLLESGKNDPDFVVETETDGTAYLRFGDGLDHGIRPEPQTLFSADYRVGNGVRGNVGADSIVHIVSSNELIASVSNPLPAHGGVEPESIEDVRQRAPSAFRTQQRAVTPDDYAAIAERNPAVRQAAATFRWTGSWHTVFLTAQEALQEAQNDFKHTLTQYMERFRMAGYDLEVDGPIPVSLEITMAVCAKPNYFRSDVKAALLQVFSNRILPDGRLGVFHPDNFTFGQTIYLSLFYATAMTIEGVASVLITTFQRQGIPDVRPLLDGNLSLNRLEIARLDNDPNFPEHGVFRLVMKGGK